MDYIQTKEALMAIMSGKALKGSGNRLFCMDGDGIIWTWKPDERE